MDRTIRTKYEVIQKALQAQKASFFWFEIYNDESRGNLIREAANINAHQKAIEAENYYRMAREMK